VKEKHHKHPPLIKPTLGKYSKTEWAIYGTTCAEIEQFVFQVKSKLPTTNFLYIDGEHQAENKKVQLQIKDKKFSYRKDVFWNDYHDKLTNFNFTACLVNGNHYPANRQIVILNKEKKESLLRRIDQLNNIHLIIKTKANQKIYSELVEKLNDDTEVLDSLNYEEIAKHIHSKIEKEKAPIKALILAGGKSSRMQMDKSQIKYHNQTQEVYLAKICQSLGLNTYISKDHKFKDDSINDIKVIKDRMIQMGPFGAIISAFMTDPNSAWLVLACDLPFMQKEVIDNLIKNRDAQKCATSYQLKSQQFMEPLISIYEPRIYNKMLQFLSLGYACPRKVLINNDVHTLPLNDEKFAFNANTPEEKEQAMKQINE